MDNLVINIVSVVQSIGLRLDWNDKIAFVKDLKAVHGRLEQLNALPASSDEPIKVNVYSDDGKAYFTLYLPNRYLGLREAKQIADLFFPQASNRSVDSLPDDATEYDMSSKCTDTNCNVCYVCYPSDNP